jgi:general secretion pathway protein G
MWIPLRFRMRPDDIERQRLARAARDRNRERQVQRRRALKFVGTRRLWIMASLIGIAVLGVLLPLKYLTVAKPTQRPLSREARAVQDLWVLRTALECYLHDCRRYPSESEGLKALVMPLGVPGWQGPYIDILKPDPWRTPYRYTIADGNVRLGSSGPDGRADTADDLPAPPPDRTVPRLRETARAKAGAAPPPGEFDVQLAHSPASASTVTPVRTASPDP